ncbi:LacI family transcriptional regulator [Vallicoccus soli]|uniref:LacI family transcriptional regulator n=1 Tax=Vallicoccus soli TaxID=2339232 RepID=A0A3A3ZI15_9ACTN|nr:LacI family transcriptional regulator [Vallicoccus soli]
MEHVARAAGVSRATASRAVTGQGPVSASARDRVLAAARALGYVPDPLARALVAGTGTRLVVAVGGTSAAVLHDPYVARVLAAAAAVGEPAGLGASLVHLPLAGSRVLDGLARDRGVAGLVLVNTTHAVLGALPPRLAGRVASIGTGSAGVAGVDVDTGSGTAAVVEHLLASGRRQVAMVTGPAWLPCTRRAQQGYERAVRAAGLAPRLVPGDFTVAAGEEAVRAVLARWPGTDAVHAVSDAPALGALRALRAAGRRVPDDVAVSGFDDSAAAGLVEPGLTTATHPVEEVAAAAARTALGLAPAPGALFPSVPVLRGSTGARLAG